MLPRIRRDAGQQAEVVERPEAGSAEWLVAVFATAPEIEDSEWESHGPHRLVVCTDVDRLRPTRQAGSAIDAIRIQDADVWVFPAAQRDTARRCGPMTVFCEIALPQLLFGPGAESLIIGRHPFTLRVIERLGDLVGRGDPAGELLARTLTEMLRLHIIDRLMSSLRRDSSPAAAVLAESDRTRILRYIDRESFDGDVSLAALAAGVGMSVDHFARAFSATFHTTPRQYILDWRIAHAKTLLLTTTQSVSEISATVGFSSHGHFTTTFRNRVGITPTDYRRHH
ncbi:helix-turn-helix transcriptional regulator [Mycolicibacterium frederiksbergense]|uniref:helix-turn-helix transcriptional regulator n=1 Tax=Mycolicibacterium frederiksbergense TaxID=117567 RepID=UPI002476F96C|nr:helix-turn-helix transcriptional regulator [Mycolicibacterium frederiksbergense]